MRQTFSWPVPEKLYITIKLPNNSEKYLQFHCEYVEYGFYYVVPMSMIFDQIFDEGHRSYVLERRRSGEKFILDPTDFTSNFAW